jgi:hypothetical protein
LDDAISDPTPVNAHVGWKNYVQIEVDRNELIQLWVGCKLGEKLLLHLLPSIHIFSRVPMHLMIRLRLGFVEHGIWKWQPKHRLVHLQ